MICVILLCIAIGFVLLESLFFSKSEQRKSRFVGEKWQQRGLEGIGGGEPAVRLHCNER